MYGWYGNFELSSTPPLQDIVSGKASQVGQPYSTPNTMVKGTPILLH